jgi:hypothetical protein
MRRRGPLWAKGIWRNGLNILHRIEQYTTCIERENARLREELAEAKRDREEARDIHNSNMNRYAERAEQAEARALANEKDALVHRKLREIALPRYAVRIQSGDTPSKYRVDDYQVCASSWDELDAAIAGAKHD